MHAPRARISACTFPIAEGWREPGSHVVPRLRQKVREMPGPNLKGVFPTVHPFATVTLTGKQHDRITPSPRSQA